MENVIAGKLDDCIEQHLNAMANLDVGSSEMREAINDLVKLYKFRIDEAKLDFDYSNKDDQHELDKARVDNEKSYKEAQLNLETQKYEMEKSDKSKQRKLETERLEFDKNDRNEQREIDKKRVDADVNYKHDQLELEKERVRLDETDKRERRGIDKRRLINDRTCEKERVKEQKADRYFKLGIAAAELVLPLTVYSVLAMLGYAREFDGVITSATLKRVTNDIKFKK